MGIKKKLFPAVAITATLSTANALQANEFYFSTNLTSVSNSLGKAGIVDAETRERLKRDDVDRDVLTNLGDEFTESGFAQKGNGDVNGSTATLALKLGDALKLGERRKIQGNSVKIPENRVKIPENRVKIPGNRVKIPENRIKRGEPIGIKRGEPIEKSELLEDDVLTTGVDDFLV